MESATSELKALWQWDATALAQGIRTGQISSREAVTACVERLHAVNPRLNAITCDLSEQAMTLADRADAAVARTRDLAPLHGVPVTIKESTDQEGCATVNGVAAFKDAVAATDNPVVANWRKAGAVIIGRTNTPAFSFRLDTVNDFRGRTHNPWSRRHTPGGSSGGASSSVAAGISPLAHGNDSAGSLRFPAYCTGIMGLRPSLRPCAGVQPERQDRAADLRATVVRPRADRANGARYPAGSRHHGGRRSTRPVVDAGTARRRSAGSSHQGCRCR
jgi:amidase